jgi:hypothetical protein
MKRSILIFSCLLVLLVVLLLAAHAAVAMSDEYDLSWNALFPGGAVAGTGGPGGYTLDSAIGQPFAGINTVASYELCAGFLCVTDATFPVYLPLVRK